MGSTDPIALSPAVELLAAAPWASRPLVGSVVAEFQLCVLPRLHEPCLLVHRSSFKRVLLPSTLPPQVSAKSFRISSGALFANNSAVTEFGTAVGGGMALDVFGVVALKVGAPGVAINVSGAEFFGCEARVDFSPPKEDQKGTAWSKSLFAGGGGLAVVLPVYGAVSATLQGTTFRHNSAVGVTTDVTKDAPASTASGGGLIVMTIRQTDKQIGPSLDLRSVLARFHQKATTGVVGKGASMQEGAFLHAKLLQGQILKKTKQIKGSTTFKEAQNLEDVMTWEVRLLAFGAACSQFGVCLVLDTCVPLCVHDCNALP